MKKHRIRTVTGCVSAGSLADDKDRQIYTLSGDLADLKSGDRMTLEGKLRGKTCEARHLIEDFGLCLP